MGRGLNVGEYRLLSGNCDKATGRQLPIAVVATVLVTILVDLPRDGSGNVRFQNGRFSHYRVKL